jgi:hypothetical protein
MITNICIGYTEYFIACSYKYTVTTMMMMMMMMMKIIIIIIIIIIIVVTLFSLCRSALLK